MTVYDKNEKASYFKMMHSKIQSDLCHELRTPLIGILGFSELLMEENNSSDVTVMATKINNCGQRLLEFIDKLLAAPIDDQITIDKNLNEGTIYTKEELLLFRDELLNRFKKLSANGE